MNHFLVLLLAVSASGIRLTSQINLFDVNEPEQAGFDIEESPKLRHTAPCGGNFANECLNKDNPTVAICVAGIARGVDDPAISKNFLQELLKVQNAGGRGLSRPEPDVFLVWKVGTPGSETDHGGAKAKILSFEGMKSAAKFWNFTDASFDATEGLFPSAGFDRGKVVKNQKCFQSSQIATSNVNHAMNYQANFKSCHDLLEAHEKKTGKSYDILAIHRPEIMMHHPLNELNCKSARFYHDHYFVMPRKGSHIFKDMLKNTFLNDNPVPGYCNAHNVESMFDEVADQFIKEGICASSKGHPMFPGHK